MKVILSRKGFDSQYGRYPSPILPDGRLISFPIPSEEGPVSYKELILDDKRTYYDLMVELNMTVHYTKCHLDPDIYRNVMLRHKDWKPLFGQVNAAQHHLENQGVNVGDLFLFFGWFKQTVSRNGKLAFDQNAPDLHVIFGYMQIGETIKTADSLGHIEEWMQYHPHVKLERLRRNKTNTLYVAADKLSFDQNLRGANPFTFNEKVVLTKKGYSRSKWSLDPKTFKKALISYHPNPWEEGYFQSTGRGQEFVIHENTEVENWAKDLISSLHPDTKK